MPVHLRVERGPYAGAPRNEIKRRAEAMLAHAEGARDGEFSLLLSDDARLRELNRGYRGKDKPTDVLAFPMREGDFGSLHASLPGGLLGDVVVSMATAKRQAREARRPLLDEVTMLVAHGLLHLLGWDHDTKAKDIRMRKETDRLCVIASTRPPRSLRA